MIPSGALLSLSDPSAYPDDSDQLEAEGDDDSSENYPPWCWPAWQERTGLRRAPFSPTLHYETPHNWKQTDANDAVWAFVTNYFALTDSKRIEYIKRRPDNDAKGRNLWLNWLSPNLTKWKMNQTVVDVLGEHSMDPYSIMKRHKVSKVRQCLYLLCPSPLMPFNLDKDA